MKKLSKSQFDFTFVGYGHYKVRYTTPTRGDYYEKTITYMPYIDDTKNEECPTQAALKTLRDAVKCGTHYSKNGNLIEG